MTMEWEIFCLYIFRYTHTDININICVCVYSHIYVLVWSGIQVIFFIVAGATVFGAVFGICAGYGVGNTGMF